MAVQISNANNARKSQMWNEQDDVQLAILLKRKIKDTTIAIRESETPYERARLKTQKARYKEMLRKVEAGAYNGDIIFNELRAAAALSQEAALSSGLHSSMAGGKAYNNAYGNVDFDYEAAFRKRRYYGISLPIIMTILTLVMIAAMIIGMFSPSLIPASTMSQVEKSTTINPNALIVYRLGNTEGEVFDIGIKADANGKWWWPEGKYTKITPKPGEAYTDADGKVHDDDGEVVYLYQDLGCTEIYIDAADIIKAWFKTKMLEKTRLDFIEDLSFFQGTSYFYQLFLSGTKSEEIVIKKNEEGNYDFGVVYKHIGVYGTILFLIVTLILMIVMLIQNIVRIFTFTSRRLNVVALLTLIFGLFFMISPALATCEGTDIASAMKNYFLNLTASAKFLASNVTTVGITLLMLIPPVICLLLIILPKLFKNKHRAIPKRIPKGNRKAHV